MGQWTKSRVSDHDEPSAPPLKELLAVMIAKFGKDNSVELTFEDWKNIPDSGGVGLEAMPNGIRVFVVDTEEVHRRIADGTATVVPTEDED